ncbi:MAG: winged helix-turn-helix transcriptional regulator [Candidatus Lokiarchaeota archaeon]|nr:winged helix-turn-helix transcriptional regulator [Candidatus Lokiarchaeota archaeon]
MPLVFAKNIKNEKGFGKNGSLGPDDSVSYRFANNIRFSLSTNVKTDYEIELDSSIKNRQTSIDIKTTLPISVEITGERDFRDFSVDKSPKPPIKDGIQLTSNYRFFIMIESNTSIEELEFKFLKDSNYGIDPLIKYSVAFFEENEGSWDLVETKEVTYGSDVYLESDIEDIEVNKKYYITLYEVSVLNYILIWGSFISVLALISLVIILTKKEYIQFLKKRTIPIEKGAHRLTLEEVLENKNRNTIIDLILEEPGIHFNELMRKSDLAPGNLVWHLEILETYKIIGKKAIANYVAYFPYYHKNPISNIDLKLSKSKLTLEILQSIEEDPGIWNNLITKRKKVNRKTVQYHIEKLIDLGLVLVKKEGRKKKLYPNFEADYYQNNVD